MATVEVAWPKWENPAFYIQDAEAIHESMAAQRRTAPVYWYEAPGLTSGIWVLSKWEHVRYVGSHPELFCSQYGFAIGDVSDPRNGVAPAARMGAGTARRAATSPRRRCAG